MSHRGGAMMREDRCSFKRRKKKTKITRGRWESICLQANQRAQGTVNLPTPPPGTSILVNCDKVNLCSLYHCLWYAGITSLGAWYTWLSLLWPPLNSVTKCTTKARTLQPSAQTKKGSNNPVWKEKLENHGYRCSIANKQDHEVVTSDVIWNMKKTDFTYRSAWSRGKKGGKKLRQ